MKKIIYTFTNFILTLLVIVPTGAPAVVHAISAADLQAIVASPYYDPTSSETTCAVSGSTVPGASGGALSSGSSVYILGDSITVRTSPVYTKLFSDKGITASIDGSSSRSIRGTGIDGNKLNGLDAATADADQITAAKSIIIALGTNGLSDPQDITALLKIIRDHNQSAPIYWVDTTVINRPGYVSVIKSANTAIYNQSSNNQTYKVLSWFKTVTPTGDPLNPSGTETDTNGYIVDGDEHVHPTTAGETALANLVVGALTGNPTTTSGGTTCFANSGGECSVTGTKNEEKIYNYLIGKGLKPFQAAGFLGNMQEEAHFEPRLVEYGFLNSRGEVSKQGSPTSLDDVVPPTQNDKGQPGYGIIQWSGGRKQNLTNFANNSGKGPGNLCTQLDFMWSELSSSYKNSVLDPVLASTTVDQASEIVTRHFEVPSGIDAAVGRRISNSKNWLLQFGSGS